MIHHNHGDDYGDDDENENDSADDDDDDPNKAMMMMMMMYDNIDDENIDNDHDPEAPAVGQARENRLCFIGKNLNRSEVRGRAGDAKTLFNRPNRTAPGCAGRLQPALAGLELC